MPFPPFFEVRFHQDAPVGSFGRGIHYSVLRTACCHDQSLKSTAEYRLHDFALIWDEDHDERVFEVVQRIHFAGLLPAIVCLGERKGVLSVLLSPGSLKALGPEGHKRLRTQLQTMTAVDDDVWSLEVCEFGDRTTKIIAEDEDSVHIYLQNIHLLWQLGSKSATEVVAHARS